MNSDFLPKGSHEAEMGILPTEGVWNRNPLKITSTLPILGPELGRWSQLSWDPQTELGWAGQGRTPPTLGDHSEDKHDSGVQMRRGQAQIQAQLQKNHSPDLCLSFPTCKAERGCPALQESGSSAVGKCLQRLGAHDVHSQDLGDGCRKQPCAHPRKQDP